MIKYLDGFLKRMEMTACIASIIDRKNKSSKIEGMFRECEIDNIIFSVLIHIMERTLTEENDCTIDDIELFLAKIIPFYGKTSDETDLRELARYIIKDILQNKGEGFTYYVMDYSDGLMKSQNVRLIEDKINEHNELVYILTSQGYDMLLRTKEVDDILGFQIEEIRLKLLISKKNYTAASEQSTELLHMLNEKQNEIFLFEKRLRRDINSVSGEEYDSIKRSINAMLNDEYETMKDIEKTIRLAQKDFEEEIKLGKSIEEIESARKSVGIISRNVELILNKQRRLLASGTHLGSLYSETLRSAIAVRRIKCFDIENVILQGLEKIDGNNTLGVDEICARLLNPLMLPKLPDVLNISLFYEPQNKQDNTETPIEDTEEDLKDYDEEIQRINRKNTAHILLIRSLLEYSAEKKHFSLSQFWNDRVTDEIIPLLTEEKLIFIAFLRLYETATVDIEKWRAETNIPDDCRGEFDLSYALGQIYNENHELFGVRRLVIEKGTTSIFLKWTDRRDGIKCNHEVEIDELEFTAEVNSDA